MILSRTTLFEIYFSKTLISTFSLRQLCNHIIDCTFFPFCCQCRSFGHPSWSDDDGWTDKGRLLFSFHIRLHLHCFRDRGKNSRQAYPYTNCFSTILLTRSFLVLTKVSLKDTTTAKNFTTCHVLILSGKKYTRYIRIGNAQNSIMICTIQHLKNMHVWAEKEWTQSWWCYHMSWE